MKMVVMGGSGLIGSHACHDARVPAVAIFATARATSAGRLIRTKVLPR